MGTPEFAVTPLKTLIDNGFNVVAIVTVPDKPQGRGQKVAFSPVKQFAIENNIPVLQPEKLKNEEFLQQLKSYNADLQIVVAFRMLPEVVWSMPKLGTFNLHAALLPQYRGAAPMNWAIINGEKTTGVTTFFIDKDIDTGRIMYRQPVEILDSDNLGTMHDKLMEVGSKLVLKTVESIINQTVKPEEQQTFIIENTELKHAPKIFKEDCRLNFSKPCNVVRNLVRGLSPYPAAFTELTIKGKKMKLKIFDSTAQIAQTNEEIGKFLTDNKTFLKVVCNDGYLIINDLQLEGKKRMKISEFLRGVKLEL